MSDICTAASRVTPHTFMRFYRLNVLESSAPSFGASVLHSVSVTLLVGDQSEYCQYGVDHSNLG